MYGLFLEHVLSDMTLWEGESGTTFFYQSELPYDALDCASASARGAAPFIGAGYRVGDSVTQHEGYGVGVYCFFRDHDVVVPAAIRAPGSKGVRFQAAFTRYLSGGPAHFEAGKVGLACARAYGRIDCVVEKGGARHGESTEVDKDRVHFASA